MSLRVLVVDDEPIARHAVVRQLRDVEDLEIVGERGDGVSAVEAIRALSPDLVFLDIQMPAITGLDVVATIGAARMPATIFVTAYEQYAVRAFETHAVDYLVKPFSRERFQETLRRARQRLAIREGADADATARILQTLETLRQRDDYASRIPVREDEKVVLVDVDDIVWVRANGNSALGQPSDGGHGIGMANTRLRLRELYGDHADLRLDAMVPRGVACRLRLPFRELVQDDDAPEHVPA